jgi:hypothetical protein
MARANSKVQLRASDIARAEWDDRIGTPPDASWLMAWRTLIDAPHQNSAEATDVRQSADAVGGSVPRKTTKASRIGWSVGVTTRHLDHVCRYPNMEREKPMAKKAKKKRRTSKSSGSEVKSEMRRYKKGTAKSGRGGKGGKVKSKKQAVAIGLSKARKKGKKVPKKK